jgi:hypothetical protein
MLIERMRERLAADRASFIEPCLPSAAVSLPAQDVELIRQWATRTPAVRKVWVFGSRGKGVARPDSDIDIAIYLVPPAAGKTDWALALYHSEQGDAGDT